MIGRRFNWEDVETIYRKVEEDKCEALGKGRYSFVAWTADDSMKFIGSAYEATVGDMAALNYWKLQMVQSRKYPDKKFPVIVKADYSPELAPKRKHE